MSYRVGTPNYNLPQTEGTDKRDWSDTNQAFLAIDTAIKNAVDTSASASSAASTAQQTADSANTAASHAQTDASTAQNLANSASELATLAKNTADSAKNTADSAKNDLTPVVLHSEVTYEEYGQWFNVVKVGKIVIVTLSAFTVTMAAHPNGLLASGLPVPVHRTLALADNTNKTGYRLRVDSNGDLRLVSLGGATISEDVVYVTGQVIYTTNE